MAAAASRGARHDVGLGGNCFVVADDLGDQEIQELLGELRVELGGYRQRAQARDLPRFARRISRRQPVRRLQSSDLARTFEAFREQMQHRRIEIVDRVA